MILKWTISADRDPETDTGPPPHRAVPRLSGTARAQSSQPHLCPMDSLSLSSVHSLIILSVTNSQASTLPCSPSSSRITPPKSFQRGDLDAFYITTTQQTLSFRVRASSSHPSLLVAVTSSLSHLAHFSFANFSVAHFTIAHFTITQFTVTHFAVTIHCPQADRFLPGTTLRAPSSNVPRRARLIHHHVVL